MITEIPKFTSIWWGWIDFENIYLYWQLYVNAERGGGGVPPMPCESV